MGWWCSVGSLLLEAGENDVVARAAKVVEAVLGPADQMPPSTKKILKWTDRGGLTVNLHRESRRAATIWVGGPEISASGEIDLGTGRLVPGEPPKNSNCSPVVKQGPTLFAYARTNQQMAELMNVLGKLKRGEAEMEIPELSAVEEVDLPEDDEALELPQNQKRVLTQSRDESVEALVSRIRKGRLILQPEFQRDFVWSSSKAGALIESILMRIPLPVIYVSELEDGCWEVVDGQQRLTAIKSFLDGRFPDGRPFRLGPLKVRDDLRGNTFSSLTQEEQNAIEDYSLRVIMIQKEADPDLKFEVFERLNSGADKLNDMELRNCIYRGPYNDLLKDLVNNQTLLNIRGDSAPDVRMQDRQLLLRFFAMWRSTHLRYRGPMKQFMNHEMQENRFGVVLLSGDNGSSSDS